MSPKHGITGLILALPIVALVTASGCGGAADVITEAGSTTVQPVAEKLAGAFQEQHPDIEITIQGGGSSVGVKSATDGTVDIGAASRELKDSEPALVTHLLAKDGIAIVCHPSNSITGLDMEEVKEIFAGNVSNWSQIGGADAGLHIVAREVGSGTRAAFEEMVMGEEAQISNNAILQPSNGAVRTTVAGDEYAIGFLSFGYIDSSVKPLSIDGIEGTVENALNGTYPIVRPLYFLTAQQPQGIVKQFIDFCLGPEGQRLVEEEGYIPVQ